MTAGGLTKAGLARLDEVLTRRTTDGGADGLVWGVARRGDRHIGWAGSPNPNRQGEVGEDTIFRITSMTKPVVAVAALQLVEDCTVRLDDPVDDLLPELADRQVIRRPDGPIEDTVPAERPITLRDLLTFRAGMGMDFSFPPQTVHSAMAERGLGAGPPQPQRRPPVDEWMRGLGELPLEHQPGEHWRYDTAADVIGVLVARATGLPLGELFRQRIFEPLGMVDTAFSVPADKVARFGSCMGAADPESNEPELYDGPDGQWSRPPAFPSGGGGLVSTVGDFLAFGEMLRHGGLHHGERLLSRPTVELMTSNHLTTEQRANGPEPDGSMGWGFGVGVRCRRTGPTSIGTYGWAGGLGSSWLNDPIEELVGVVLTTQRFTSPALPPVIQDFWTCAYAAFDD
jgi:CubicO group peptidase (beta-lactamase class C family)